MNLWEKTLICISLLISTTAINPSFSQNKPVGIDQLVEKANYYDTNQMPDSIIWITEEILPNIPIPDSSAFFNLMHKGINAAITNQNHQLFKKYTDRLLSDDHYKNDGNRRGKLFYEIATRYTNMHEYNKSMEYCKLAFSDFKNSNNYKGISEVLLNMYDNAYFSQEDSTNTEYIDQAIEIAQNSRDSSLLSEVYFTVGRAYYRDGDFIQAIDSYNKARENTPKNDINHYLGICIYQHLVYTLCDSITQACQLSSFILHKSLELNLENSLSNAYLGRAYCSAKNGLIDSTRIYLDLSEESRSRTQKVNASPGYYNQMYKVSMIIEDYDRALRYLEIKSNQEKQINRRNSATALGDSRAEFDYLLQKARIGELSAQNEAETEKAQRRKVTIMGISAILLISLAAFLNSRKQYKKLSFSYKSLVRKHVEVDKLNHKLLHAQNGKIPKRTGVHIKDEDKILAQLRKLMEEQKIYKRPDLSLNFLAGELGTNTTYLSTIINTHFNVNLKSLINKYRIDEARKLLVSDKGAGYSIEGIAHEVGFQSRSVFYQTFKQITGLTPTAYLKTYKSVCPDS